jgi:hypothetical protein
VSWINLSHDKAHSQAFVDMEMNFPVLISLSTPETRSLSMGKFDIIVKLFAVLFGNILNPETRVNNIYNFITYLPEKYCVSSRINIVVRTKTI